MSDALLANYARAPVTFVRGEGSTLIADDGARYLDFVAGLAVCALGHAHPEIARAIAVQASELVHCSNLYRHEPSATLANELAKRSGYARVFFCNSGTEANEAAIKLARKAAHRRGDPQRTTILACSGSFHGRTFGSLAATDNPRYHEGFAPLPGGFAFTPFDDIAALDRAIDERVAAFIVEPVQGESGIHVASEAFLAKARALCTERGAALVFDEIQCGMGRLGTEYAFQTFAVRPDALTMAKALANGLPIGAMLVDAAYANALQPGDHGSTFGGSPVPCAAALAHLLVRDEAQLDDHVRATGALLRNALAALAADFPNALGEVRGLGMMLGLQVKAPYEAARIVDAARERKLLVNAAGGNTLRIVPPLILTAAEVERGMALLREAIAASAAPRASAQGEEAVTLR
jgi:predicted acetylornithine/succinylornithine family transaminase